MTQELKSMIAAFEAAATAFNERLNSIEARLAEMEAADADTRWAPVEETETTNPQAPTK